MTTGVYIVTSYKGIMGTYQDLGEAIYNAKEQYNKDNYYTSVFEILIGEDGREIWKRHKYFRYYRV